MSLPQGSQPIERILPPKLPYDMFHELVSALGKVIAARARREDLSRSWIKPDEAKATLVKLAYVSKSLKEIAYPHIYAYIELTSSGALQILLHSLTDNPEMAQRVKSLDVSNGLFWTHHHNWPHPPVIHNINDDQQLAQLPLRRMQSDLRVLWRGVCQKNPIMAARWDISCPNARDGVLNLVLLLFMLQNLRIFRSLPGDRIYKADYLLSTIFTTMPSAYARRFLRNLEVLEIVDLRCRNNVLFLRQMVLLPKLHTLDLPICEGLRGFRLKRTFANEYTLPLRNLRIQSAYFSLHALLDLLRGIQRLEILHYPISEYIRWPANGGIIKQALDNHRRNLKELNLVIDHHHANRQNYLYLVGTLPLLTLNPSWSFAAYSNLRSLHIHDVCLGFSCSDELERTDMATCLPVHIETLTLMTWIAKHEGAIYADKLLQKCVSFARLEQITLLHVQENLRMVRPRPTVSAHRKHGNIVFQYIRYCSFLDELGL